MLALQPLMMLTDQEANIQIALITAIFALVGILVTSIFAKIGSHPKVPKKDPDSKHGGRDSLLLTYSGEQNDFMHLVIQDSKDVHYRMDQLEANYEQMKKERNQLLGAFTRYISKLASSWGSGSKIPYPDDDDFKLLEETLPIDWRRRT